MVKVFCILAIALVATSQAYPAKQPDNNGVHAHVQHNNNNHFEHVDGDLKHPVKHAVPMSHGHIKRNKMKHSSRVQVGAKERQRRQLGFGGLGGGMGGAQAQAQAQSQSMGAGMGLGGMGLGGIGINPYLVGMPFIG